MRSLVKWASLAAAIALLGLVAINLFDEGLDPEAAAYGKPRPSRVPERENGYLALLATGAPDGADGMDYARAWLDEARAAARQSRPPKPRPQQQAKRPELCDPQEPACLAAIGRKGGQAVQELEPFKEDLARYEALLGFDRFEEVLDYPLGPESEIPQYAPLVRAQRAYLWRVVSDIEAERAEEGVAALEREFAWQRLFVTESRLLAGKMAAVAGYWRDLKVVANLLDTRSAQLEPYLGRLKALLGPLDAAVLSMPKALEVEFAFASAVYPGIGAAGDPRAQGGSYAGALFYRKNATLNHAYHYFAALGRTVFGAPAHRVAAESQAWTREWRDLAWWRYLYNPLGKSALSSVALPPWEEYSLRMHDLDALNRLVGLRLELLAAGIGPERAAEAVAASGARFHDPYTQKPMRWDPAKKRLFFEAGAKRNRGLQGGAEAGRVFVSL